MDAPVPLLQPPVDLNTSASAGTAEIKVLQVSAEPIFNLGGVGLIVLRLIRGLPHSFRTDLACPDATINNLPDDLREQVGELIAIPSIKWSSADKREFVHRVRDRNYDLIHFHGGMFSFDAHLPWRSPLYPLSRLGIPWVYSNHCAPGFTTSLFPEKYPLPLKMLKSTLAFLSLTCLITLSRGQIFDSCENQERIATYFPWAKRKFTTIYHSGLEGEPPKPIVRESAVTIGNLGHIGWRKGQLDLLEAFCLLLPKFPDLQLLLVGPEDGGDCAQRIRAEIGKRNLERHVSMPGGLTDLRAFWDKVDIYVQPSHFEGAPMSLMEAAWHGKPAVGTCVSGIPEIIAHEVNGLLVEAKNPQALAAALERLIVDSELRRRFAAAGAAHVLAKGMTRSHMVKRHLDLYTQLFAARHARI